MALKGKFLKERFSGKARYVYTVHGSTAEIADYIEKQGDNIRYLQEDGTIGVDETDTPVYYSIQLVGKNPTLRWNEDYEYFNANMTFEDSVVMDAARRAFTSYSDTSAEDNTKEDADLDGKTAEPAKPAGNTRSRRKVS